MQNPIQKFRKTSIVFAKPGILSENLKTLTSSNYPAVQYVLLKHHTRFLLTNVYKKMRRIFSIAICGCLKYSFSSSGSFEFFQTFELFAG